MVIRRASLVFGLPLAATLTALLLLSPSWGTRSVSAEGVPTLELDVDPTNGSGPCNPVDSTRGINVGDTYQVAICLTNAPNSPGDFQFEFHYSDDLNQCIPSECVSRGCLDNNPDANAGATTWGDTSLGPDWSCDQSGEMPPTCDTDPGAGRGHGVAFLECVAATPPSLSAGDGISAPIAMVTLKSVAKGTDEFALEQVVVDDWDIQRMVGTRGTAAGAVAGGTVSTEGEFPPTATVGPSGTTPAGATPGAAGAGLTATAAAATAVAQGTPLAAINEAATATAVAAATKAASGATTTPAGKATAKPASATAKGGGSSGPNAGVIAGIVIAAVIVIGGAGWFGYRRLRATK